MNNMGDVLSSSILALSWPGEGGGLGRAQTSGSEGASGTKAPMKRGARGGDGGHERAILLRFG